MDTSAHSQPEQQQQQSSTAVHFLDYWQVLYARKEIVIAVMLLVILTGIVVTSKMPRVYASNAVIQVQRDIPGVHTIGDPFTRYDPIFLVSQFEKIKSYPVMERVVKALDSRQDIALAFGWQDVGNENAILERMVELIRKNTSLAIRRETDIIEIRVRLSRPEKPDGDALRVAVEVANTIAKVYGDYARQENLIIIEERLDALKIQIDDIGRQITQAEVELAAFRHTNNVTLLADIENGAASLRSQIAAAQTERNRARLVSELKKSVYERIVELSTWEAASALPILVGDNSLAPSLQAKESLEINLSTLSGSGFGAQHPDVVKAKATLDELNKRIEQRVRDIKTGLRLSFEQAQTEFDMLDANLAELQAREIELTTTTAVEFEKLNRNLLALKMRKAEMEQALDRTRVDITLPSTTVKIIEEARMPEDPRPISPNFPLNLTLSIIVGLVFGIGLAFFVEYLDTTIKSVDDVEKHLQTNIVGVIPNKIRTLNSGSNNAGNSEIYRVLRMNLKSSKRLADGKIIMITSASAGEGKSTTSFNLAYVCAEVGERTLILDADLHRPVQHKILGLSNDVGLSNVIVGEATLDQAIQPTGVQNLDILSSGRMSRFSVIGLVDTDEMRNLLAELRTRYDRIIMDTPPIIGVSDTAPLVRLADGVALVVHHRKYPRGLCKRARDLVVGMGGNLLGVILNNIEAARDASSYYYKYQYYYYYYYSSDNDAETRDRPARRRRAATKAADKASKA